MLRRALYYFCYYKYDCAEECGVSILLRLIRMRIEDLDLNQISSGDIQEYHQQEFYRKLGL